MELLRVQAVLQPLHQSLHQQILIYIHDHPPIEIHSKGLGTNQHTKSHYSYPSYWQTNSMTWSNASNYINYISCAKFVENNIIPCWCRGCDSWLKQGVGLCVLRLLRWNPYWCRGWGFWFLIFHELYICLCMGCLGIVSLIAVRY